jgi:hypothetical protein
MIIIPSLQSRAPNRAKGDTDAGLFSVSSSAFRHRITAGFVEKERRWQALPIDLGTALGDSLVLDE